MFKARFHELSVEEVANTITHGFGFILSVIGFVILLLMASLRGGGMLIASCFVYGLSLVVLYAASTAYHGVIAPEKKQKLQIVDHCGIYLLIAGSYTPFGTVILGSPGGRVLLVLIWAFAGLGITVKLLFKNRFSAASVVSYLIMGWIGVFAIQPLLAALGFAAIALAVAGGVAYSLGVIFFAMQRLPHNHAIFHVFVLIGSVLHYLAVVMYVVPSNI
ncbi:MAG: PAQR family membrane homeostasis protein TrhA [Pyrinomonadaceae bacterium]